MSRPDAVPQSPRVSVVIPAYNHGRFLPEALDSVLRQSFQDFEVVVVDDGSEDDTAEVVAGYRDRVRYIYQVNAGQAAARNRGIRETTGSLVAFLDADDYWLPEKLAAQVAHLEAHPDVGVVFTQFLVTDAKGTPQYRYPSVFRYGRDAFRAMLVWPIGWMNVALVRRTCFDRIGLLDETIRWPTDWDLWLRVTQYFQMGYVPRPLAVYRQLENSLSRRQIGQPRAEDEFRRVLDRLFADPDLPVRLGTERVRRLRRLAYASLEVTLGLNLSDRPWRHVARAAGLSPSILATRWRAVGLLCLRGILGEQRTRAWDEVLRRGTGRR